MFFRTLSVFALALAAAATNCPVCPTTDLDGNALVANSGGTLGTPRFCGYSPDATGASGPSVLCFYNDGNGAGSGPGASCPPTATIADAC
ncbi:hypothetical protein MVEN_00445500 [Mycena venus]|uniref:Uncharacterized protein n=1 Tax=Mycena venus TaxID=2733690 RepID=A0A8H6YR48_9AGAR|nr:hypothetical protein MVEN_00445500 [Mycena venus]